MRFKIQLEFIQTLDPDDFPEPSIEAIKFWLKDSMSDDPNIVRHSLEFEHQAETLKVTNVEYLDNEF